MKIMIDIFIYLLGFIIIMTLILGFMKPNKIKAITEFFVAVLPKIPITSFIKRTREKNEP